MFSLANFCFCQNGYKTLCAFTVSKRKGEEKTAQFFVAHHRINSKWVCGIFKRNKQKRAAHNTELWCGIIISDCNDDDDDDYIMEEERP